MDVKVDEKLGEVYARLSRSSEELLAIKRSAKELRDQGYPLLGVVNEIHTADMALLRAIDLLNRNLR